MENRERITELDLEIKTWGDLLDAKDDNWDYTNPDNTWDKFQEHTMPERDILSKLSRERRLLIDPKDGGIPEHGTVMPLTEFIECVESGGFIDYDGYGEYIKDGKLTDINIYPSDILHNSIRSDMDTIIWYNR